jgi:hypothetical protein
MSCNLVQFALISLFPVIINLGGNVTVTATTTVTIASATETTILAATTRSELTQEPATAFATEGTDTVRNEQSTTASAPDGPHKCSFDSQYPAQPTIGAQISAADTLRLIHIECRSAW